MRSVHSGKRNNSQSEYPVSTKEPKKRGSAGVAIFRSALLAGPLVIGIVAAIWEGQFSLAIWGVLAGLILFSTIRYALEWESAVILRFGRLRRIAKPGLFLTIPIVDSVAAYVDQRLMVTSFQAERTLTADCVPVNVDAVLFWMVWDPKSACLQVNDYREAVYWAAQTALRDAIGTVNIAELSTRRRAIDEEIQKALTQKTTDWGITVTSVEIRDIIIPIELQDAMSKEAQAEFERNARVTLAEAEEDISEMFIRAAQSYGEVPEAMKLRGMNMLYEGVKEKGGLVLLPSTLADFFAGSNSAKEPQNS